MLTAAALVTLTETEQKYTLIRDREKPVRSLSTRFTRPASPNGFPRL
ncbi:MAG: hypothetical protein AVDCRST_MAG80-346 [uncultured Rubrobacteraceae bacterium]|uniref:Uncharacterized protein n=1 Tax=uncultured Rubrobacteraceae bacterium TaxID=349277 RepID=A0A6J4PY74_9ACTN|nr:MAG: hypothetical protein AVDCRST_MAG80-346 [uncultured Rubrobacteraceae bacterium]